MAKKYLIPTIKFKILGRTWKLKLLTKKAFEKRNGADCFAVTWSNRVIELSSKGQDIETIRHELVHAYQKEMCLGSTNEVTPADMEEWIAELIGRRGPELLRLADVLHVRIIEELVRINSSVE